MHVGVRVSNAHRDLGMYVSKKKIKMENEKIKRKGRDAWGEMYYQISAGAVGLQ
jgi:hypothetical protein